MAAKTINELTLKLNADMAELRKDLKKATGQLNSFQKGVKSIGSALKGAFVIGAIAKVGQEVAEFTREAIQMGGEMAGVKESFDKLNQPGLLDEMKKATLGTISELELMKKAMTAKEFNLPMERMGSMMQFATIQAQKMGKSVDYMAESLTTGLARGSAQILDNLGISLKELQAETAKVGSVSEAALNIMDRKVAESGGVVETASTITARWGARWENMKASIGLLLNNALVKISPILEDIRTWFVELWQSATKFIIDTYNGWVDLYNRSAAFRLIIESISGTFNAVWGTIKAFFSGFWDSLKTAGKLLAYTFNPANWGSDFGKGLNEIMMKNIKHTIDLTKELGKDIGNNLKEGVKNVMEGSADYLTVGDLAFKGGAAGAIQQAKELGTKIKQAIIQPISMNAGISSDETDTSFLDSWSEKMEEATTSFDTFTAPLKGKIIDLGNDLNTLFSDIFISVGQSIGDAISGAGNGMQGFIQNFIDILSNFGQSVGKQLIAVGVALLGFKASLRTLNGPAAIAAGIALTAASVAFKNIFKKGFAGGGIVPGSSTVGDRVPILANGGEMMLNQAQQSSLFRQLNSGGTGGGGVLSARVAGKDLLFILNEADKRNKSSF